MAKHKSARKVCIDKFIDKMMSENCSMKKIVHEISINFAQPTNFVWMMDCIDHKFFLFVTDCEERDKWTIVRFWYKLIVFFHSDIQLFSVIPTSKLRFWSMHFTYRFLSNELTYVSVHTCDRHFFLCTIIINIGLKSVDKTKLIRAKFVFGFLAEYSILNATITTCFCSNGSNHNNSSRR